MLDVIADQFNSVKRFLRMNAAFYLLSICVLTAFLVIIGILFILQGTTKAQENYIRGVYEGNQLYRIIDNFYDGEAFYEFRQHPGNIDRLGKFYNELVKTPNIKFISAFNQAIPIENFQGDEQFFYNSQAFRNEYKDAPSNVKAIQLNPAAFRLYQPRVASGKSFDWREVNYSSGRIPVLLGSNYSGVYGIDDIFKGNYYACDMTFEVVGILEPNTFIYYKGDSEFYLDSYIIVPYPEFCTPVDSANFHFEGILYFAMINGDIMSKMDEKALLNEVKNIANKTGFIDFSLVGISDFAWKYDTMISVIRENQNLLFMTMLLVGILVTFIQYGIGRLILARRIMVYKTYWLLGDNSYQFVYFRDIAIPYLLAFIFSNIIIGLYFQRFSFIAFLFIWGLLAFILGLVFVFCSRSLKDALSK